ncbi:N-acetylneuraminate synthase family protein [candidate division KSB1 bacterium]|nr:N-acetylneuraminate synthase family protein [candidate division KSB1 bacterium]
MHNFKIGKHTLGFDQPLYFVADIAANHDGSIERAFKLIELAKESGAHAAKFQNFIASKIVSRSGFDKLGGQMSHQSKWKKSVFETYEDASVSYDWTAKLKEKCEEVDIEYFTSPYDFESVDHVDPYVKAYKIGSGDVTWHNIIEYIAKKGKPVFIATGASTLNEVKSAMGVLQKNTKNIVLMQCNTNYTASIENYKYINLNVLKTYANLFPDVLLGLSDHTHGHATVLGAISLGARVFEKHFTDDNSREGPDHTFAMNPKTWREMVDRANEVYLALGDSQKKIEENEQETAVLQRRGLRFTKNLLAGHIIEEQDLFPLRPRNSDGIPPYEITNLVGKELKRDVKADDYIRWEDIE